VSSRRTSIGGRTLSVSNLDKVLYPATGTTKAAVIAYYLEVAEVMLPHLAGRPVTFRRFPDGVRAEAFYQKHCPGHRPGWLPTVPLGREDADDAVDHCDIREPAALAWAANLGALEFHVPMARATDVAAPTAVVFDLDPGAPAGLLACAAVAAELHELFDQLGLSAVAKTSGGKGLQVYLPVDPDRSSYAATRAFARAVAQLLQDRQPDRIVTTQVKSERSGKVLIDWMQNHRTKTTVCAYSLRGRDRPTVSTPVTWEEVDQALRDGRDDDLRFELGALGDRIRDHGDLFEPVVTNRQQLPDLS
jgi:bifunctional non-homologous end joining protein LigD